MAPNAATAVFNTSELAELILLLVGNARDTGTKDIVRAPRICRSINNTICGSRKLKQKLFLSPSPLELVSIHGVQDLHPLSTRLRHPYMSCPFTRSKLVNRLRPIGGKNEPPWAFVSLNPIFSTSIVSFWPWRLIVMYFGFDAARFLNTLQHGSMWEDMYICQPPASEVEVFFTLKVYVLRAGSKAYRLEPKNETIWNSEGVRLQQIAKTLRNATLQISDRSALACHVSAQKAILSVKRVVTDGL